MKAYSIDLRERVVAACDAGDATREQVAARFSVSVPWIRKLLRQRRQTGSIAPKPRGGGRVPAFDGEAAGRLRGRSGPTTTPPWRNSPGPRAWHAAPSAVHRALARLGVTRKKSRGGRPSKTAPS